MASHEHQHYIPRFFLKAWESGSDCKIEQFRWAHGVLKTKRYKAQSVGKERHLWSLERSSAQPNTTLERDYWGPHVDDPAAIVLRKILEHGISKLDAKDIADWIPFVLSLLVRSPAMMERIRSRGREVLEAALEANPEAYVDALEGDTSPPPKLKEMLDLMGPDALDDFGVTVLPDLTFAPHLMDRLLRATWAVRSVNTSRFDLMIGDRPLLMGGSLVSDFVAYLPLTPRVAFLAFNHEGLGHGQLRKAPEAFARGWNKVMVESAHTYIYGTTARQEALVFKCLRKPPG